MSEKETGGQAFPSDPKACGSSLGMTLRDHFAGLAMPWVASDIPGGSDFHQRVAALSYEMADAMLEARK